MRDIGPNSSRLRAVRLAASAVAGVALLAGFKAAGSGAAHGAGCGPAVAAKAPLRYAGTLRGDVDGDGRADHVTVVRASTRPGSCRFALVARRGGGTIVAAIHTDMLDRDPRLDMLREEKLPALYSLASIDRRPGAEIVVVTDRGASDLFFTVFTIRGNRLRAIRSGFTLGATAQFGSGVDCTRGREPGDVVVTGFWSGKRFGTWHVRRAFYSVSGSHLRGIRGRTFLLHGREPYLRFHELGGDAFRSCTVTRNPKVW